MLTTLFASIAFLLLCALFYNSYHHKKHTDQMESIFMGAMLQIHDLEQRDNVENYNALEQGMTELEESYQAEILDRDDKIQILEGKNQQLSDQIYLERDLCIDRQTVILFLNDELTEAREAGLNLQRHILDHEGVCLPVLTMNEQGELTLEN